MNKTSQKDNQLMTILKLHEISRFICDTDKGPLKLKIRKGDTKYYFTLDATELDKETNKELMELLYPKPVDYYMGKPVPEGKKGILMTPDDVPNTKEELAEVSLSSTQKKRGRPKLKK